MSVAPLVGKYSLTFRQYFATRRSIVSMHNIINDFSPDRPNEWKTKGSLIPRVLDATGQRPRTCGQEIAGIVGYGAVGMLIILHPLHDRREREEKDVTDIFLFYRPKNSKPLYRPRYGSHYI